MEIQDAMVTFSQCETEDGPNCLFIDAAVGEFGNCSTTLNFDEGIELHELVALLMRLAAAATEVEASDTQKHI